MAALVERCSISGESVPVGKVEEFLTTALKLSQDPLFFLRLGLTLPRGAYGAVEFVWRSAPDLATAWNAVKRYEELVSAVFRPRLEVSGALARLDYPLPAPPLVLGRLIHEFVVASATKFLRELTGERVGPWRVGFAHDVPAEASRIEQLLGAPAVWRQTSNWVEFDVRHLSAPIASADAALFQVLCGLLDRLKAALVRPPDFLAQVDEALLKLLERGSPSLSAVAHALHMSPRTLQRRLATEGATLKSALDGVRRRRARELLANSGLPLQEIAWQLGFSQFTAFARAYKRWEGVTPGAARATLASATSSRAREGVPLPGRP
ncbi:MAG: AraC family transcriptional regulator ligand-binding domain-containing protein [Myxococcota bacterium]